MSGFDLIVSKLEERGLLTAASSSNGHATARCPAHNDNRASLSVSAGDSGKVLVFCFAGCEFRDIIDALGLTLNDVLGSAGVSGERILTAQYVYTDEHGDPLIRVSRWEPKGFSQERWEAGSWVSGRNGTEAPLYRLPEVQKAVADGVPIYIMEGEKDVEVFRATQTGACATTLLGGANKRSALPALGELRGAEVFIVCDRDDPGRSHGELLLDYLTRQGSVPRLAWPVHGKDFTDHVYGGGSADDLARDYEPVETDWDEWDDGIPDVDWLVEDVVARGTLVWAYGSRETAKSMALMGIAAELSRRGERVAYYGEEMDRRTEARRLSRFRPNRGSFFWKNGRGLDLSNEDHVASIIRECRGVSFIILDSYERVWGSGRANENRRAVEFARTCHDIILATGATICVIDHTGFPFRDSDGNLHDQIEPRGASSKLQQADTAILFKRLGEYVPGNPFLFTMENKKPGRLGNPFFHRMQVVDTEGGGLAVVRQDLSYAFVPVSESISGGEDDGGEPAPKEVDPVAETEPELHDRGYPAPGDQEVAENALGASTEPATTLSKEQLKRLRVLMRVQGLPEDEARLIILAEDMLGG